MIIQDNQFAVYAQKQPNTNVKQPEQTVKTEVESEKENSNFKSRFEEKAASLSISEKMGAQIFEIRRAVGNLKSGNTTTQITDTALDQVQSLLHRTNALTIQALNDTNTSWNQESIDRRIQNLKEEIERVSRMGGAGQKESVQSAEERIASQPEQAMTAQANQDTERVLGLLL